MPQSNLEIRQKLSIPKLSIPATPTPYDRSPPLSPSACSVDSWEEWEERALSSCTGGAGISSVIESLEGDRNPEERPRVPAWVSPGSAGIRKGTSVLGKANTMSQGRPYQMHGRRGQHAGHVAASAEIPRSSSLSSLMDCPDQANQPPQPIQQLGYNHSGERRDRHPLEVRGYPDHQPGVPGVPGVPSPELRHYLAKASSMQAQRRLVPCLKKAHSMDKGWDPCSQRYQGDAIQGTRRKTPLRTVSWGWSTVLSDSGEDSVAPLIEHISLGDEETITPQSLHVRDWRDCMSPESCARTHATLPRGTQLSQQPSPVQSIQSPSPVNSFLSPRYPAQPSPLQSGLSPRGPGMPDKCDHATSAQPKLLVPSPRTPKQAQFQPTLEAVPWGRPLVGEEVLAVLTSKPALRREPSTNSLRTLAAVASLEESDGQKDPAQEDTPFQSVAGVTEQAMGLSTSEHYLYKWQTQPPLMSDAEAGGSGRRTSMQETKVQSFLSAHRPCRDVSAEAEGTLSQEKAQGASVKASSSGLQSPGTASKSSESSNFSSLMSSEDVPIFCGLDSPSPLSTRAARASESQTDSSDADSWQPRGSGGKSDLKKGVVRCATSSFKGSCYSRRQTWTSDAFLGIISRDEGSGRARLSFLPSWSKQEGEGSSTAGTSEVKAAGGKVKLLKRGKSADSVRLKAEYASLRKMPSESVLEAKGHSLGRCKKTGKGGEISRGGETSAHMSTSAKSHRRRMTLDSGALEAALTSSTEGKVKAKLVISSKIPPFWWQKCSAVQSRKQPSQRSTSNRSKSKRHVGEICELPALRKSKSCGEGQRDAERLHYFSTLV